MSVHVSLYVCCNRRPIIIKNVFDSRGVARISIWGGPQVERQRRENRGAEGAEGCGVWGEGVPLATGGGVWGGGCAPSPENFWNFYIKMVSCRAFWVAISYRLAACFTRIRSDIVSICSYFQMFIYSSHTESYYYIHYKHLVPPNLY